MNTKRFIDKIVPLSSWIYSVSIRYLKNEDAAADAVQEIMLKLWKKRKVLDSHPNPKGFVYITTKNHCLDNLKRKRPENDLAEVPELTVYLEGSSVTYEQKEMYGLIIGFINELPDLQKDIILMRDIDGLEFNEIVVLTDQKIENIRVLLSRARKKIGSRINEIYNYERERSI